MKILVCLKQVPDSESPVVIDENTGWLREDDLVVFRMNRYDEYALEEAVLIREVRGDVTVDVISVGPSRVTSTLKKGLEKGANNGIHITLEQQGYVPPSLIARLIADYAVKKGYDLIFTGVMAEDDMQCQVGPLIAARLGIPCAASVLGETISEDGTSVTVECELEGGVTETIVMPVPSLLAIQSGINRPRYPSLSNVMRAKEQVLEVIDAGTASAGFGAERFVSLSYPEITSKGTILQGTAEQKAEQLLNILHEKSLL